jgi:hypothetical protein
MAAEHHGLGTTMPEDSDGSFSDNQVHAFQKEDIAAAKSIIFLMSGVFTLGLVGSILVCRACWG